MHLYFVRSRLGNILILRGAAGRKFRCKTTIKQFKRNDSRHKIVYLDTSFHQERHKRVHYVFISTSGPSSGAIKNNKRSNAISNRIRVEITVISIIIHSIRLNIINDLQLKKTPHLIFEFCTQTLPITLVLKNLARIFG